MIEELSLLQNQPKNLDQLYEELPLIDFKKQNFKNCGKENKDKLECRICMCEFEDGD